MEKKGGGVGGGGGGLKVNVHAHHTQNYFPNNIFHLL